MAGDWHFSPEAEEQRAKSRQNLKEKAEKYNDSAFTPDSKTPVDLATVAAFESLYETLCYNIALTPVGKFAGKLAKPLTEKGLYAIRKKLSAYVSKDYVDKFMKLVKNYSEGKIDSEQFLNKTQSLGETAQKYFVDRNNTEDFVKKSLSVTDDVDKKAVEDWSKNAAKEAGNNKLAVIAKALESKDTHTSHHVKNVGIMLEKYLNEPNVSKWLTENGYDVGKVKKFARLLGESHDDGKLLIKLNDLNTSLNFKEAGIANPISPHEPEGQKLLEMLLSPEEDKILGAEKWGDTFSKAAKEHGDKFATKKEGEELKASPLMQLLSWIDRGEANASPRPYKAGNDTKVKNWFSNAVNQYNFPDEVKSALSENYSNFYKEALEERLGRKIGNSWDDIVAAQRELINQNPLEVYHNNLRKKALQTENKIEELSVPLTVTPTLRGTINAKQMVSDKATEKKPSTSSIRTVAYNKYKGAYKSGIGKNKRKLMGFFLSTIGVDPATIGSKMISYGDPEELKNSLRDFNTRFQASDQDDSKKDAIRYITDNWDSLSDADKAYFKHRIETDNKDFINKK